MKKSKVSVSIKQLASILGLSPGTVSFVLNGRGNEMRISKATQDRVLETARELGLEPKAYTNCIREAKDKNQRLSIAVFSPYLKGVKNVLGSILYGMQGTILQKNLPVDIIIHPYNYGNLSNCKNMLSSGFSNGAIIAGLSEDDVHFLLQGNFDIPIVLFNRITEKYSSVFVEDYEAGNKVASIFHKRGHKNVGLIMPNSRSKSESMRQMGFCDGCSNWGLNVKPYHIQKDELNVDGGYRAASRLLEHADLPSALFIQINDMAPGVINAIKERNIKVPDNIEIITYGTSQLEELMSPSLSSIHIPVEHIATECLNLLLDMIKSNDWRPISRVQPLTMIFRESCPEVK